MGIYLKGQIAKSPVGYEVKCDNTLNVSVAVSYTAQAPTDPQFALSAAMPLAVILQAAVAQKGGIVGQAEVLLVSAIEAYLATLPA